MADLGNHDSEPDTAANHRWLAQQRRILEHERADLRASLRQLGHAVPASEAPPTRLAQKLHTRLAAASLALTRMDHGRYGRCERCSQAIERDVLAEQPTARYCRACSQD
ncbi:MAG: hypothetical protein CL878_04645 [Dehalococcoidia bacterium]|nr:hypothetical protein [Dehalococcoidia bacterium]